MARKKLDTLTEPMYYVLLSLVEERHGYGVMQYASQLTGGRVAIGAGTLYALLDRFERDGLIIRTRLEDNRKYYRLTADGRKVLDNVSFRVNKGDKIAFVGEDEIAKTTLFKIVMGEMEPDEGTYKWGTTITTSYFPLDNSAFFNDCDLNLVDWLAQFTPKIPEANTESFKRAFLGRMLFSGDDVFKPVKVLSGGEKVRCMLSRMMLYGSNVLVLDQPTNHLDLESITAVNNGLVDFKGVVLFSSHDHEFVQTIANRIMVLEDGKLTDRLGTYEDYIASMANTAE